MKLVIPSFKICAESVPQASEFLEKCGRVSAQSTPKGGSEPPKSGSELFVESLIRKGHESVLEHASVTVKIVCDRGISHELVRHRIGAFTQESTRYCKYKEDLVFVKPLWATGVRIVADEILWETPYEEAWVDSCLVAERTYHYLVSHWGTDVARGVLPTCLKTELFMTFNLRQWRHFFKVRALGTFGKPHPEMLRLTVPMLIEFKNILPVIFKDLEL